MKKSKLPDDNFDRQIYIENRNSLLDDLRDCLVNKENSYAQTRAINIIEEQKKFLEYIQKKGHRHTTYKEEVKFLDILVKTFNNDSK